MRLETLQVHNFRCFSDLSIAFNVHPRTISRGEVPRIVAPLTVLVARNGQGKTAVLDAARIAFGTFTGAFDYDSPVHIDKADIRIAAMKSGGPDRLMTPVQIEAQGIIKGKVVFWRRTRGKERGRTSTKEAKPITEYGRWLKARTSEPGGDKIILPVIAHYGTGRLWKDHKNTLHDKPLTRPRDYGYDYALDEDSNYKAVAQWLLDALHDEMTHLAYGLKEDSELFGQLGVIRNALSSMLEDEGYDNVLHVNPRFKSLAVRKEIDGADGLPETISVPISSLSDGTKAVFFMIADIAFRCAKLNPTLGIEAAEKTPGIVFIDEVDLHLHPAWQQKILDTLQWTFPMVQFIVTTHSPQVVSSIPRECVRIVDNGAIAEFDIQTQGVEIDDILSGIFGTAPLPQNLEIVKKLNRLDAMVSEQLQDTDEWRNLYSELETYYGPSYAPLLGVAAHAEFMRKRKEAPHA